MKLKNRKVVIPVFLFSLIALALVRKWFIGEMMLAGAEEGIPLYDSKRTLDLYSNIWFTADLGIATPVNLIRVPFYTFASFLHILGLNGVNIQILVFSALIFVGLYSTYLLSQELFPKNGLIFHISVSLFYLFNLYTLSQIWARFLYPQFFLWSYLPLFLYLCIKWIQTARVYYLIILILSSLLFSPSFVILSSLFVLWSSAFLYIAVNLNKNNWRDLVVRILTVFLLWITFNLWWLAPIYLLRNNSYGNLLQSDMNYASIIEVSKYYPHDALALLQQNFYFGEKGFWKNYYSNINLNAVSYTIFLIVCIGIAAARKTREYWYIILLTFIGWFVSKGTNPPLGEQFFYWLFTNFPITQVLRNPYEKFGLVYVLGYAFLFSLGVYFLTKGYKKFQALAYIAMFYFAFYQIVHPMWDGSVVNQFRTTIPNSYKEVNEYLVKNESGRILQMPYLRGSDVKYTWGYRGNEPSEFLFDYPSISKTYSLADIDDFYLSIPRYISHPNFSNILAITDTEWIILHNDIIQSGYYQESVPDSEKNIKQWNGVKEVRNFGDLKLFQLSKDFDLNKIYIADSIFVVNDVNDAVDAIVNSEFNFTTDVVAAKTQNSYVEEMNSNSLPEHTSQKLSTTSYKIDIKNASEPFVLVLANNFNQNWIARVDHEVLSKHIEVNGFANGWIIDKKGDYTIDVVFKVWPWQ